MEGSGEIQFDPEIGLDRKAIRDLKLRFLKINLGRIQRTRDVLPARQRSILELIPLFLHVNHPLLPGYISPDTPAGISSYMPDKDTVRSAQQIARSFKYTREPNRNIELHSIFVMGSIGSIGQTGASDLDIWVCHRSTVSAERIAELSSKCLKITEWCERIGLEAHFFPMSPTRFSHGETGGISTEDCGSAQHFLLLEEFYRTAILLAGRYPAWWLTPSEHETRHAQLNQILLTKRHIREDESIDFGGISEIPAGEYVGAGMWQIYKGIDSPYKSLLKILLTEVYASRHPEVDTVGMDFKRKVFGNATDLDELDPYVLAFRKIENYLIQREETERLDLARRCLYIKSGQRLSRALSRSHRTWRRTMMEALVAEWGWDAQTIRELDDRSQWKARAVKEKRRELVNNLTYSYRFLSQFAREKQSEVRIDVNEMAVLGRKLYAAFERKADKIEMINPGIAPDLSEESLTFVQQEQAWLVFDGAAPEAELLDSEPLRRSRSIVELALWTHMNGLLTTRTTMISNHAIAPSTEFELQKLAESLRQTLPSPLPSVPQANFEAASRLENLLLFVNTGHSPPSTQAGDGGVRRVSSQSDALAYSAMRENLVACVDLVTLNSWNELHLKHFCEEHALAECLTEFLRMVRTATPGHMPKFRVQCFSPELGAGISARITQLLEDLAACFFSGKLPLATRYVIQVRSEFLILQFEDQTPLWRAHKDEASLMRDLSSPQPDYSPVILDRQALLGSPLRYICQISQPDYIQVFYTVPSEGHADLYVVDELGSIFRFRPEAPSAEMLLRPLDRFLRSVVYRRKSTAGPDAKLPKDIQYFEMLPGDDRRKYRLKRSQAPQDKGEAGQHSVQAIADRTGDAGLQYRIYCNHREFSPLEHGKNLMRAVATHIVGERSSAERYPCYLTDLDLGAGFQGRDQTAHYLLHKQRLESALLSALREC